jgi:hypothetical protein
LLRVCGVFSASSTTASATAATVATTAATTAGAIIDGNACSAFELAFPAETTVRARKAQSDTCQRADDTLPVSAVFAQRDPWNALRQIVGALLRAVLLLCAFSESD